MKYDKCIQITGGAGFIGSHVLRRFLNEYPNYHIFNLDALTYVGNLENLKGIEYNKNYSFLHGDISEEAYIYRFLKTIVLTLLYI